MAENIDPVVKCVEEKIEAEASGSKTGQSPKFTRKLGELRKAHLKASRSGTDTHFFSVDVSPDFHVSRTPLKDLNPISLQELKVECTFLGGYLILRTIEFAYGKEAITTIVEDKKGTCAIFKLFNYSINMNPRINEFMPIGTVFALKEPICSESIEGDCVIRCESLSDMIIIYEGDELSRLTNGIAWKSEVIDPIKKFPVPTTACAWKDTGEDFYSRFKYQLSTRCFYLAQKNIEDAANKETFQIMLNLKLGLLYCDRGFYEKSLTFIEKVLQVKPDNLIAMSCAGKCYYFLRKYEDSLQCLERIDAFYSLDCVVRNLKLNLSLRIDEKLNGSIKVLELVTIPFTFPYRLLDHADYVGPVTITEMEGKGRSVVATRDIAPGTLLVVSKALAFSFKLAKNTTKKIGEEIVCWQDLLIQLAQRIACNPKTFGPIIYSLCDGKSPGGVDLPAVFCDPETEEEPIVDMAKLKDIIVSNIMGNGTATCQSGYGIFDWPSHFNHSCVPNTSVTKYNDLMVIRATNTIREGAEAFIPCMSSDMFLHLRKKLCSSRGVQCTCQYCQMDRELPEVRLAQRLHYVDTYQSIYRMVFEKKVDKLQQITANIRRLIDCLQVHYEEDETLIRNFALASVYTLFSKAIAMTSVKNEMTEKVIYHYERQIECAKMVLKLSGFNPPDMLLSIEDGSQLIPPNSYLNQNVFTAVAGLISYYNKLGDTNGKKKWIKIMLALELIYSGGDIRVLQFHHPSIRDLLNAERF